MKRRIIILGGIILCLFWSSAAGALDSDEQAKVDRLATVLNLTPVQKQKLSKERETSLKKLRVLERKWQGLHDRLRLEVRKDKPDRAAIDKISKEIGTIQGEIVSLRTNSLIYLKSLLTPSQITLLEKGSSTD